MRQFYYLCNGEEVMMIENTNYKNDVVLPSSKDIIEQYIAIPSGFSSHENELHLRKCVFAVSGTHGSRPLPAFNCRVCEYEHNQLYNND
jgi:hypothetical protein